MSNNPNSNPASNRFNPNSEKFDNIKIRELNEYIEMFESKIACSLPPPNLSDSFNQANYELPPINNKGNKLPIKHANYENDQHYANNGKSSQSTNRLIFQVNCMVI